MGQKYPKGCRPMIKLNCGGTYYKNLIDYYKTFRLYSSIYKKNNEFVDIVDDPNGLPCVSIYSDPEEIKKINSPLVFVDAVCEGENIVWKFLNFPKNKKYVLLTNSWINRKLYIIEQNYHHIQWNYSIEKFLMRNNRAHSLEFWQKKHYDLWIDKPCLFCCLIGTKKHSRDFFVQNILSNCQHMSFYLNYAGQQLALESRQYDITYDFSDYDTYRSLNDHEYYDIGHTIPISLYNQCRFNLVVESIIDDVTQGFHLTEKTLKPILSGMPFVLMSGPKYLEKLKSLGYKTFDTLWDESYDQIDSFEDRVSAIIKLLKFLNNQFDWTNNLSRIEQIVNHNKMNFMYNTSIFEKQIVDFAGIIREACA